MLINLTITQLLMALFEKFFHLHIPQTPLYQENITSSYFPKGPNRMGGALGIFYIDLSLLTWT